MTTDFAAMHVFKGVVISEGINFGKICFLKKKTPRQKENSFLGVEEELKKYEKATDDTIAFLKSMHAETLAKSGKEEAAIFEVHQMMLTDLDYVDFIKGKIVDEKLSATKAVLEASNYFSQIFASMSDEYMKARAKDVEDVSRRLLDVLEGQNASDNDLADAIVVVDELMPSQVIEFTKKKVAGFIAVQGSATSHSAILARNIKIPTIFGVSDIQSEFDGRDAIIDGYSGTLYINPEHTTIDRLRTKKELCEKENQELQNLKNVKTETKDHRQIELCANIGNVSDVAAVIENAADGIGLFRSEFLYLKRDSYPSEEEQFAVYKEVVSKMAPKRVVIRTLDIGADKKVDYFDLPKEENPAMGYRAIRICLDRVLLFKTQLRAILRSSAFGKVAIMFPMIISVSEVREIKKIVTEVKEELHEKNIPFADDIELGIMIETPAAAVMSDELAREVDFFSVGTNDLTQYTLACDRQNNKISKLYDPGHKAVLRLIKVAAENAHKNHIWIGICGEIAANPKFTEFFLSIGIDELSMSAPFVLTVKKKILETDVTKIEEAEV